MPTPITNSKASSALAAQFGVRGRFALSLDEVVVPVSDAAQEAGKGPLVSWRRGGDFLQSPAVAARFSGVMIRPGQNLLDVIEELYVMNGTGTAFGVRMNLLRPADVASAALNITLTSQIPELASRINNAGFFDSLGASISIVDTNNLNLGAAIFRRRATANQNTIFPIPRGIRLDGSDPAGLPAIVVFHETVNTALDCGAFLVEHLDLR